MESRYLNRDLTEAGEATRSIHGGTSPDLVTGAILPPIYQTATYAQEGVGINKGHTYSRSSNPTVKSLELRLAAIEGANSFATCFATGMAAMSTLLMTLMKKDEHLICSDVLFGGSVRLIDSILSKYGITASYVDAADPKNVAKAIKSNTKLIFLETPANPTLKLNDIEAISKIAKENNLPLVVDNTFMSSLQKPFDLGADIILYSTTKYIDGHNSTVGGALLTTNQQLATDFEYTRKNLGNIQAPFEAWLILQGLKTLGIRIKQHSDNALQVAKYLKNHPKVSSVIYPGLDDFPQLELAKKQHPFGYHGGMLVFEMVEGYDKAISVMNKVKLCALAESLGSTESLITHPASMTHAAMTREAREVIGLSEGMIRLSVGLEDVADIIKDLEQAMS
ncbi:trans-sulfuration enzyme family protein [Aquella oligotrophica]|uniref:Cystathionine gamma-synthase n=1 Tax=Aquella oligotrophica TaxID=2067065 RepID=A0A2I7N6E6_9NEIS|nr:aminotransferase class I/II-fold pyridoxal phosphate-dependent enzyme [Aquella oligotrophica]AUR52011.1 cystathionine gamma-synthase [Aquella oligotrophica]